METLSTQIAIAIENARLYAETQRRLQELEVVHQMGRDLSSILDIPALADTVVYQLAHALGVPGCLFILYDASNRMLSIRGRYVGPLAVHSDSLHELPALKPLEQFPELFQIVVTQQRTVQSVIGSAAPDSPEGQFLKAFQQQAVLALPLRAAELPVGMIVWLDDRLEASAFDGQQTRLAQTLANQAAVALERARLHEETNKRLSREMLLRRVAEATNSWGDQKQLVNGFAKEVRNALNVSECLIYAFEMETVTLIPSGEHGQGDEGNILALENFPDMMDALDEGKVYSIRPDDSSGATDQVGDAESKRLHDLGYAQSVVAPLISKGQLVGALEILDNVSVRRFTDNDLSLLMALANQLTVAMDNVRLIAELEDRAKELAKASQLKSEFLANISHELRTPMNSIIGFTDTLIEGVYGPLTEKQTARMITVRRNATSLLNIINDLLDISKIEAGRVILEIEPIRVGQFLHSVVLSFEPQVNEKGLTLSIEVPDSLPDIETDVIRLRQIFTNLLGNAIKFTGQGEVVVSAEFTESVDGSAIHFEVKDSGVGISDEDLQIIFDEFRQADGSATRRFEGTGLGLAISRKLVRLMGGELWAESQLGEGSTFHVIVPLKPLLTEEITD
jgi:signal transduction histidine kinase